MSVVRASRRREGDTRPTLPSLVVQRPEKQEQALLEKAWVDNILVGGGAMFPEEQAGSDEHKG